MTDDQVAALIREVLAEELARLGRGKSSKDVPGSPRPREEEVEIGSDDDLQAFARKVLSLAGDPAARRDIVEGRLVFRLAGTVSKPAPHPGTVPRVVPSSGGVATVDGGVLSERQVDRLPADTQTVRLARAVKLTPLARDRLAGRGIRIERMER